MELEGLKRTIKLLQDEYEMLPEVIITDRHLAIQKWIRESLPVVSHYYDCWHVAKGLSKKLELLAKQKGCENVREWIKSISNHMYWCAASSENESGDLILAKWLSLGNHLQNIHNGHSDLFPDCLHPELQERNWLKPR
jgi:hypothetical protein